MFQKLEAVENRYEELNKKIVLFDENMMSTLNLIKKLQTQKLLQIQANGQSS